MGLFYFLFVYVLGGVTFIPLLVAAVFLHAHITLPHIDHTRFADDFADPIRDVGDEDKYIRSGGAASLDERFKGKHDSDLAEGYFAVCREYVPGGVNGKPPERTTGAGDAVPEQSPSVYQSMYRSLFSRQNTPTLEPNKTVGRFAKKPRNVFYVVLRHGHLMLYDDEFQVEVRHVVSLNHHKVDLYGGGSDIPEGELWIKRNAVRLVRKDAVADSVSKPFYFFSENCSEKEDFYHAMLQNQERLPGDSESPPSALNFDNDYIISLIQKLHSSEEQFQTRWLNALIGRWFLAIYKTKFIEDAIRMKITKKIARVKKPGFLTGIILRNINLGRSAPSITNPKLRDLTIDGNCSVEADFRYEGNVRVEIAATVRIDLGARFKAREVELVLAVTLKKLVGRGIIRFKPPPSNRLWMTFETMPKMELSIEPIWGSRQITYGVVLRQIENRIREVVAETLVMPFWDDIPFYDTEKLRVRGGIWAEDGQGSQLQETFVPDEVPPEEGDTEATALDQSSLTLDDRSNSNQSLAETAMKGLTSRKGHKPAPSTDSTSAASSGVEKQVPPSRIEMPRAMRSTSSAAAPTLTTSGADSVGIKHERRANKDATSLMREISSRSQPNSPPQTPLASQNGNRERSQSPLNSRGTGGPSAHSGVSFSPVDGPLDVSSHTVAMERVRDPSPSASLNSAHSAGSAQSKASTKLARLAESLTPSEAHQAQLAAISAAAANASRSWTWGTGKKGRHSNSPSLSSTSSIFKANGNSQSELTVPSGNAGAATTLNMGNNTPHHSSGEPYGRGRPLPPPGQPLPPPDRASTFAGAASAWMGSMKRKSVSNPHGPPPLSDRHSPLPDRKESISSVGSADSQIKRRPVPAPPLPVRRVSRAGGAHQQHRDDTGRPVNNKHANDVVIVSAPQMLSASDDEQDEVNPDGRAISVMHEEGTQEDLIDMDGQEGGDISHQHIAVHSPEPAHVVGHGLTAAHAARNFDEILGITSSTPRNGASSSPDESAMPTPLAESRRLELTSTSSREENTQPSRTRNTVTRREVGKETNTEAIPRPATSGTKGDDDRSRDELLASELMARESIAPADLLGGPG